MFSYVTWPVKELKDFRRIYLIPDESKTISRLITPKKLVFYDINMDYKVENGDFEILVGSSSNDKDL